MHFDHAYILFSKFAKDKLVEKNSVICSETHPKKVNLGSFYSFLKQLHSIKHKSGPKNFQLNFTHQSLFHFLTPIMIFYSCWWDSF